MKKLPLPTEVAVSPAPPPLETEPLHKRLARLTKEHAKVTESLRALREDWKEKNLKAQQTRTPVPTSLVTHVENQRRELHLQLERLQAEIGSTNKLIRERKAHSNGSSPSPGPRPSPKLMPFKEDPDFPTYFLLAARDALAPALFEQVVRTAKSLMHEASRMGIDQ